MYFGDLIPISMKFVLNYNDLLYDLDLYKCYYHYQTIQNFREFTLKYRPESVYRKRFNKNMSFILNISMYI